MAQRDSWQYCQIEVNSSNNGILRQFFADRAAVEMQLYQNWPAMIGKLGIQGWKLISAVPGASGKGTIIYIFSRMDRQQPSVKKQTQQISSYPPKTTLSSPPPSEDEEDDEGVDFEPLRGI